MKDQNGYIYVYIYIEIVCDSCQIFSLNLMIHFLPGYCEAILSSSSPREGMKSVKHVKLI